MRKKSGVSAKRSARKRGRGSKRKPDREGRVTRRACAGSYFSYVPSLTCSGGKKRQDRGIIWTAANGSSVRRDVSSKVRVEIKISKKKKQRRRERGVSWRSTSHATKIAAVKKKNKKKKNKKKKKKKERKHKKTGGGGALKTRRSSEKGSEEKRQRQERSRHLRRFKPGKNIFWGIPKKTSVTRNHRAASGAKKAILASYAMWRQSRGQDRQLK